MNIIFLDVDGVLNNNAALQRSWDMGNGSNALDRDMLERLRRISDEGSADIVVSSDWRLEENNPALEILRAALFSWDLPIFDVTPDLGKGKYVERWLEISSWLGNNNDKVDRFVILDDRRDAGLYYQSRFVKTNPQHGLTREKTFEAVHVLKNSPSWFIPK